MPSMPDKYSIREVDKAADKRVYHHNSACPTFREIPKELQRDGTNNYRLCEDCTKKDAEEKK